MFVHRHQAGAMCFPAFLCDLRIRTGCCLLRTVCGYIPHYKPKLYFYTFMHIMIVSETLVAGGAEWFSLRLADALQKKGHAVSFVVLRPDHINRKLTDKFPGIRILTLPRGLIGVLTFFDKIISRLGKHIDLLTSWANSLFIGRLLRKNQIEVIHGHLMKADLAAMRANKNHRIRQITTIHGDYIQYIKEGRTPFVTQIAALLPRLDRIVIISDEQAEILSRHFPEVMPSVQKVYNGYPLEAATPAAAPEKNTFHFGMIARGIPEKGWEPAIQAFCKIPDPEVRLVLYGESDYLDALKQQYPDPRIQFAGFTDNPLEAVQTLDVGLLPSYYPSESLPTTIIEYLAMEKPVIATQVGEISRMVTTSSGERAGIVLAETDPAQMVEPLYQAMVMLVRDKEDYARMKSRCKEAFQQFSMEQCVNAYLDLYKS